MKQNGSRQGLLVQILHLTSFDMAHSIAPPVHAAGGPFQLAAVSRKIQFRERG